MRIAERIRGAIIESMTALKDKIKLALDESRMLILGAQILLGFDLRAAFEPAFDRLSKSSQMLKMATLVVLLCTIALIMAPGSYHRIVRGGSDAEDVHQFATMVMDIALVPILVVLALDIYLSTGRIVGMTGGIVGGAFIGAVGFFFWYGLGLSASKREKKSGHQEKKKPRAHPTDLKTKIDQALTEARVVLPGAQALLGFQLITMFMDGFDKLPNSSKYIHMISLGWMALTIILLMSPAAYHRIAERGEDTTRMHDFASVLLLAAMVTLPIGICGDVYVVLYKVTSSLPASLGIAIAVLTFFYGTWFGFTTYRRARLTGNE
ncbi:MAG TPA: DUF6328 family protein [Pyrinomonadaceae bacterium]